MLRGRDDFGGANTDMEGPPRIHPRGDPVRAAGASDARTTDDSGRAGERPRQGRAAACGSSRAVPRTRYGLRSPWRSSSRIGFSPHVIAAPSPCPIRMGRPGARRRRCCASSCSSLGPASLGAEISAARLLAPYFGASTIIWANTIATVLVALSAGYAVGGRLADRRADLRGLCAIVLAASLLLALVPFVADPFLRLSVKALGALSIGGFLGSLGGRARARGGAGDAAGGGRAVRQPACSGPRVGRRHGHGTAVRDLDCRFAGRDVRRSVAADPARRHASDIPRVRVGARACGGARARLEAGLVVPLAVALLLAVPPMAIGIGRLGREGHLSDRDALPVRAGRAVPQRRAVAAAERRGCGPLTVYPGQLPDRRLLGRLPRAPAGERRRAPRRVSRCSAMRREQSREHTATSYPRTRSTVSSSTAS